MQAPPTVETKQSISSSCVSWVRGLMTRYIAHRTLAMLSSADIATYRDQRLKVVSASSVISEEPGCAVEQPST